MRGRTTPVRKGSEEASKRKEIEGFHLPAASLRLSAQGVIKESANRVPLIKTNLHPQQNVRRNRGEEEEEKERTGGRERMDRERRKCYLVPVRKREGFMVLFVVRG